MSLGQKLAVQCDTRKPPLSLVCLLKKRSLKRKKNEQMLLKNAKAACLQYFGRGKPAAEPVFDSLVCMLVMLVATPSLCCC